MKAVTRASEDSIHISIVDYLKTALPASALVWHTPNTFSTAKPQFHAKLKRLGRVAGIPDLFVLFGGELIALEVKAVKGRLSGDQRAIHAKLKEQGIACHIVRSIDDVAEVLALHGISRRSAA
jgi:hypothetical protein